MRTTPQFRIILIHYVKFFANLTACCLILNGYCSLLGGFAVESYKFFSIFLNYGKKTKSSFEYDCTK
ncbi:hypothetical protein HMPREF0027_1364 [Actinobacillus ureae ATCC 25976]|uniref:Uncharacterized protein n=1 Tax=Actinobacillus ureae ATCC 25976 TaxID=887324 RepID=E8KHP7_9PAST|nr:hypothetical protein HMPREF0027_1364 [Actinobacillus ureae ATCC 25976]